MLLWWFLWTVVCGLAALLVWRRVSAEVRVYVVIVLDGLYLSGIFVIYALVNHLPL